MSEDTRLETLFLQALELEPEERTDFFRRVADHSPDLLTALRARVAEFQDVLGFLDAKMVPGSIVADGEPAVEDLADQLIGPYRLEKLLGRGGMGSVYLAERADGSHRRKVAIKILHHMHPELVQRFENEQQIMANLEHPHIARLYDSGISRRGEPYIVMEYIEGMDLAKWLDTRNPSFEQRLELFQKICGAIHHAHKNLIVHRDIKPFNIMIGEDGEPKVLDFGIAKALESGHQTETGLRPMTRHYASPEQILGRPLSTAGDTFSLGVLLYEIMTGSHPHSSRELTDLELENAICRTDPDNPVGKLDQESLADEYRRYRKALTGELGSILNMAMAKEPADRYDSVLALAEDIQAFRDGFPVRAKQLSLAGQALKFIKRHRLPAATVTTSLLFLLGFLAMVLVQKAETERERDKAQAMTDFLIGLFDVFDPNLGSGNDVTAVEILEQGTQKLADMEELEVRTALTLALGRIYRQLGLYDEGRPLMEDLQDKVRRQYGENSAVHADVLHELATQMLDQMERDNDNDQWLAGAAYDYDALADLLPRVLAIRKKSMGPRAVGVADALVNGARHDLLLLKYSQALEGIDEALAIYERQDGVAPQKRIDALVLQSRILAGMARYREATQVLESLTSLTRDDVLQRAHIHYLEGDFLTGAMELPEARIALNKALQILEGLPNPNTALEANYKIALANTWFLDNDPAAALPHLQQALQLSRANLDPGHAVSIMAEQMTSTAYYKLDQLEEAAAILEHSIATQEARPEKTDYNLFLAYSELGKLLMEMERFQQAVQVFRQAVDLRVSRRHYLPIHIANGLSHMGAEEEAERAFDELLQNAERDYPNNAAYLASVKRNQAFHWVRSDRWQTAAPALIDFFDSLGSSPRDVDRYNWALHLQRLFRENNDPRVDLFTTHAPDRLDARLDPRRWYLQERHQGSTTLVPSPSDPLLLEVQKREESFVKLVQGIKAGEIAGRQLTWRFDYQLEGRDTYLAASIWDIGPMDDNALKVSRTKPLRPADGRQTMTLTLDLAPRTKRLRFILLMGGVGRLSLGESRILIEPAR